MDQSMREARHFEGLVDGLRAALRGPERFTLNYNAETSTFIRFNKGKVRQAGNVQQASLSPKLINEGRHADIRVTLSGEAEVDQSRLALALQQLRETLPLLPVDP